MLTSRIYNRRLYVVILPTESTWGEVPRREKQAYKRRHFAYVSALRMCVRACAVRLYVCRVCARVWLRARPRARMCYQLSTHRRSVTYHRCCPSPLATPCACNSYEKACSTDWFSLCTKLTRLVFSRSYFFSPFFVLRFLYANVPYLSYVRHIICFSFRSLFPDTRRNTHTRISKRKSCRCLYNDQFVAWLLTILILLPATAPLQFPDSINIDQFCL